MSDWSSDVCSSDLLDRVQEARAAVLGAGPSEGRTGHEDYLRRLDGMVIGDSPDQGFVRGRHFIHPTLRFTFTVPPEFTLANGPAAVRARAAHGAVSRSEERRVGKECVSTGSSRWLPYN